MKDYLNLYHPSFPEPDVLQSTATPLGYIKQFGEYLLSESRSKRIAAWKMTDQPLPEKRRNVYQSDLSVFVEIAGWHVNWTVADLVSFGNYLLSKERSADLKARIGKDARLWDVRDVVTVEDVNAWKNAQ